ncbi:hypothetical protein HDV00_000990 [Rhizophlyctis rosea]|nr:hypothetical protein HDV00_000990 [Rhizophlyctis rosea]
MVTEVQGESDVELLLKRLTSSPSALSGFLADIRDWDAYRLMMRRHNRRRVRGASSDTSSSPNSSTISISAPEPIDPSEVASGMNRRFHKRDSKLECPELTGVSNSDNQNVGAAAVAGAAAAVAAAAAWNSSTHNNPSGAATISAVAAAAAAAAWSSSSGSPAEDSSLVSRDTTSPSSSPHIASLPTQHTAPKTSTSCQTEPPAPTTDDAASMRAEAVQLLAQSAFRVVLTEKESEWAKERRNLHNALQATEEKVVRVMRAISDALKVVTPEDSLSDLGDAMASGVGRGGPRRSGSGRRVQRPILKKRVSFDTETLVRERMKEKAIREMEGGRQYDEDEEDYDWRKGRRRTRRRGTGGNGEEGEDGWDSWSSASSDDGGESDDSDDTRSSISTLSRDDLLDRVAADPALAAQVARYLAGLKRRKRRGSLSGPRRGRERRLSGSGPGVGAGSSKGPKSSDSAGASSGGGGGGGWAHYRMMNASRPCLVGDDQHDEINVDTLPSSSSSSKSKGKESILNTSTNQTITSKSPTISITKPNDDEEEDETSPLSVTSNSTSTPTTPTNTQQSGPSQSTPTLSRSAISLHPSSTPLTLNLHPDDFGSRDARRRPSSFPPSTEGVGGMGRESPPRGSLNEEERRGGGMVGVGGGEEERGRGKGREGEDGAGKGSGSGRREGSKGPFEKLLGVVKGARGRQGSGGKE